MLITQVQPEDFPAQDNLFQTSFWGKFKSAEGSPALFFLCSSDNGEPFTAARTPHTGTFPQSSFPLLVLLRRSVSGDIYAFAPKAPSIFIPEDERGLFLEDLSENLKPFLPKETVCIRYDTFWPSSFEDADNMPRKELLEMRFNFGTKKHLLRKSTSDHFCPNTVLIDLSASPEQMLTRMRQTTRNSIRKSYREGVTFSEKDLSFLPVWHNLYKKTGLRKKFYTEEKDYFEMLLGGARRFGRLFFKPVASPHEDCGSHSCGHHEGGCGNHNCGK